MGISSRNKYTYYASKAKKMVMNKLQLFLKKLQIMKRDATLWFKELNGGVIPDTIVNLEDAASGENFEWMICIKRLQIAQRRRFDRIADLFEKLVKLRSIMKKDI